MLYAAHATDRGNVAAVPEVESSPVAAPIETQLAVLETHDDIDIGDMMNAGLLVSTAHV
jgi:hypothetical protein